MNPFSDPQKYFRALHEKLLALEITGPDGASLPFVRGFELALREILEVRRADRVVALAGNGGSAAIAAHMQIDLMNSLGVKSLIFSDTPTVTAVSNDYGYPEVYARQLRVWARVDDLLIAISSSGRSENILRTVDAAHAAKMRIITFSGFRSDNPLRQKGHVNFWVPADRYGEVELAHACLAHYLTDQILAAQDRREQQRPPAGTRKPAVARLLLRREADITERET